MEAVHPAQGSCLGLLIWPNSGFSLYRKNVGTHQIGFEFPPKGDKSGLGIVLLLGFNLVKLKKHFGLLKGQK